MHTLSFYSVPKEGGTLEVNNTKISAYPWNGYYFNGLPITLKAKPKSGYKFIGWEGIESTSDSIIYSPTKGGAIVAVFEEGVDHKDSIIINEINYNSASNFDSDDWVELYNRGISDIDISDWLFKDEDDNHIFIIPKNTILKSNEYLVLINDSTLFESSFPSITNYTGSLGFGFSGSGELLRLFDDQLNLIDSVHYDDELPWALNADGKGSSLELKSPDLNNDLGENWSSSINHGTPGEKNSINTDNKDLAYNIPYQFELLQNYPNPFNPTTKIKYSIALVGTKHSISVQLEVYDILGNEIAALVNCDQPAGSYEVTFDASKLASGIYFYTLKADNFIASKKLILLK